MKRIILALALVVGAPMPATFAQQASKPAHRGHVNPSFEQPAIDVQLEFVEDIEGWSTTDRKFEIWRGFNAVKAYDGMQCVELNAEKDGTLFQDSDGIEAGAVLEFTFAHRGRNGKDTMQLTITDLGADGKAGTDDDKPLFEKQYTTDKDAWAVYTHKGEKQIVAVGNTIRFAYTAVFGTAPEGNDKSQGNLLDAANFGVGVVSEPEYTFVNKKGDKGAAVLYGRMHKVGTATGPQGQEEGIYQIETEPGKWLYAETSTEGANVTTTESREKATKWQLHLGSKGWGLVCTDNGANVLSAVGVKPQGGGTPTGKFQLRRANGGGNGQEDQLFQMFKEHLSQEAIDALPK